MKLVIGTGSGDARVGKGIINANPAHTWQSALLLLGGFLIGISKTGITGLGTLAVAVLSLSLPTRV